MAERHNTSLNQMDSFPPTVTAHTLYSEGVVLHTTDADPETDIEVLE